MYGSVGRNRMGIGPVKNSAYPQPLISLAMNDLGNGAVDTSAGNQSGLGVASFTRATNAACRLSNGNWKLDVANGVARSHYLLGTVPAYVNLPGTSNNYASTPDAAAIRIAGDIRIETQFALDVFPPPTNMEIGINRWNGGTNTRSWLLRINAGAGSIDFSTTADGTLATQFFADSTVAIPATAYTPIWIAIEHDVDNENGGSTTTFYTSLNGVTWTQLGAPTISSGVKTIYSAAGGPGLEVGTINTGSADITKGKIGRSRLYSGIGRNAVLIADFNPSRAAAIGSTSFVASTGETWTINGLAYIDANPVYGGYLMESAATQLALNPRDMTQASWVKTTMTAAQTATGMDGVANSATTLTATGANATVLQTLVTAASLKTYSAWIRRRTGTGTIAICQDGVTFTDVTAQINSSNFVQVQLIANQLNPQFGIRLGTNGDAIDVDCNQFEAGEGASTPIPSGGTRNNDALSYTYTPQTQGVGSMAIDMAWLNNPNTPTTVAVAQVIQANGGNSSNQLRLVYSNGFGTVDGVISNTGVSQADFIGNAGVLLKDKVYRCAMNWAVNDMNFATDSTALENDATGNPATDINSIFFNFSINTCVVSACSKNLKIWPTKLPNPMMKLLVTP